MRPGQEILSADGKPLSVLVVKANKTGIPKQDYSTYEVVYKEDDSVGVSQFFNQVIDKAFHGVLVFLGPYSNLASEDSLSTIVKELTRYPDVNGIYSDIYLDLGGGNEMYSAYPIASLSALSNPILSPFACFKGVTKFDEKLSDWTVWGKLRELIMHKIILHVPKPLFVVDAQSQLDPQELKYINEKDLSYGSNT